jgi:hypothetical protein
VGGINGLNGVRAVYLVPLHTLLGTRLDDAIIGCESDMFGAEALFGGRDGSA